MSSEEQKKKSLEAHEKALSLLVKANSYKKLVSASNAILAILDTIPTAKELAKGFFVIQEDILTEGPAMDLRKTFIQAISQEIDYLKGKRKDPGYQYLKTNLRPISFSCLATN